jgi:hypothetical protein
VRFFINSDKFFKGAVIAVSAEKFRTFEKLLEHLTRIMCNQVTGRAAKQFDQKVLGKNGTEKFQKFCRNSALRTKNLNTKYVPIFMYLRASVLIEIS